MTEGLLKKRIQSCLDNHYSADGCANCWFQDIDEAKKDFPTDILLILKNIVYAKKYKADLTLHFEDSMRILNWIEKWFGDSTVMCKMEVPKNCPLKLADSVNQPICCPCYYLHDCEVAEKEAENRK